MKRRKRCVSALDLFAGIGGSSHGARLAGVQVKAAVDVWNLARDTYVDNHPGVHFFGGKCEYLSAAKVRRDIGAIDLIIASPECTSHTCAKGSARRSEASRRTAFEVVRFARKLKPRWIIVENVVHMRSWTRYRTWIAALERLGYKVREQVLNAAEFGVPQSRRRLFVICDLGTMPPEVMPTCHQKRRAASIIHHDGFRFSPLWTRGRAAPTIERAERAISAVGDNKPFLLVYYGSDAAGGWQRLEAPLRTITTLDRFALVRPNKHGHEMRMLQIPELKRAMGFPNSYVLRHGTRRDRIKLLGNAVCPPVMRAVVRTLTATKS